MPYDPQSVIQFAIEITENSAVGQQPLDTWGKNIAAVNKAYTAYVAMEDPLKFRNLIESIAKTAQYIHTAEKKIPLTQQAQLDKYVKYVIDKIPEMPQLAHIHPPEQVEIQQQEIAEQTISDNCQPENPQKNQQNSVIDYVKHITHREEAKTLAPLDSWNKNLRLVEQTWNNLNRNKTLGPEDFVSFINAIEQAEQYLVAKNKERDSRQEQLNQYVRYATKFIDENMAQELKDIPKPEISASKPQSTKINPVTARLTAGIHQFKNLLHKIKTSIQELDTKASHDKTSGDKHGP